MSNLNDRLEQLAELQKQNLEPLRHLNDAAFSAFERIARKNYELMGDMVEYAVAQTRSQLEAGTPQEVYARQIAEARAFAERIGARANEYVALAEQMRDGVGEEQRTRSGTAPAAGTARGATSEGSSRSVRERGPGGASAPAEAAVSTRNASEKTGSKATGSNKAPAKKAGSKKSASKKASAKKTGSKKTGSNKASAKKAGSKKTASTRGASGKAASKRVSSAKKSASKKRGGSKV